MTGRGAGVGLFVAAFVALVAACGVEVPDEVAEEVRDTTTTTEAPTTTETPRSDDELEQALIDNGYTLAEARCGAENLRDALDEEAVQSIVDADTIEDISASTARDFADAIQPCVEDGAGEDEPEEDDGGGDDGDGGSVPGFGDDSEGEVSRSRFLAALITAGLPDGQARCVVDGVFSTFEQGEIDDLFHAASEDEIPADILDAFDEIVAGCS